MSSHTRKAFTMIELVFVIVILGILAAIAVPKFAATRDDAKIAKTRSTIAAVRSGIVTERQQRLFRGDNSWIEYLDDNTTLTPPYFTNVIKYGETDEGWTESPTNTYTYSLTGKTAAFTYEDTNGTFDCTPKIGLCATLTQ